MGIRVRRRPRVWMKLPAAVIALCLIQNPVVAAGKFRPFSLETLDGKTKSLGDYLGRLTLVTFFFPTCGYCNGEFPHLQRIYDQYKDRGLVMVSINIMPDQDSLLADWQLKHKYTFPVLTGATLEKMEKHYDLMATPTHFLLDSRGKVLFKQTGYKPGDENALEERIREALSSR